MIKAPTTNQHTNAYAVTNHTYSWGASIESMAAHLKQFQSTHTPVKIAEACREEFYREFWELSRKRAKTALWTKGFTSGADQNAEDAASLAIQRLLDQEEKGTGVFRATFPSEEDLRKYLSGTVAGGAWQGVRDVLRAEKRACALSSVGMEALDKVLDPRHEEFDLKQLCMDVREASMAIAPKYKERLPEAGTTPLNEVLIGVCLDKVESDLAKRTYQRLQKDLREDLRATMGL